MQKTILRMRDCFVLIFLCVLSNSNLAWATDGAAEQTAHARIRFIGNPFIGLTFVENRACFDEDNATEVSRTGPNLGTTFNLLKKAKNISLDMTCPIFSGQVNLE